VLYRAGDPCGSVYLLRSGFIKTVVLHPDGREQVSGFYMAGEMLGLDGIASGKHASDASALTDSEVCVVPYERLETVSHEAASVQRYLYRMLSQEVVRKQSMMLLLGSMRAEERVATFLLNLSQRFTAQGFSSSDFILRMTRDEIGSLLGMKLETVSRILSKFQKAGVIRIEGKHVRIVHLEGLRAMISH
jgi:CRP/FNR family transcriptional regulator